MGDFVLDWRSFNSERGEEDLQILSGQIIYFLASAGIFIFMFTKDRIFKMVYTS